MITYTADQANELARNVRERVIDRFHTKTLGKHAQGLERGMLLSIEMYLPVDPVVMAGVWNEVNFYCRRADQRRGS